MNKALRKEYLAAIGVPTWKIRTSGPEVAAVAKLPGLAELPELPGLAARPRASREAPVTQPPPLGDIDREGAYDWTQLRARVAACTLCALSGSRTQTVIRRGQPASGLAGGGRGARRR